MTSWAANKEKSAISSVNGLIKRLLPDYQDQFVLELISREGDQDVFEVGASEKKVLLRGSSGVALASALHEYLKTVCHVHISWCGDQMILPDVLPIVTKPIRKTATCEHRVFFNYCTINYSASWWDWKRWEREIDFMALNGITMPLMTTGLESVWYNTLLQVGFSDDEARSFLVGPAFLAWQWMTNIQSHCGPLPLSWIRQQAELGKKIIQREREFGMTPILQGFSGYVPRLMQKMHPEAAAAVQEKWCNFEGVCQLNPLDPLFTTFGRLFLKEQIRQFGTNHLYAADPFHESNPPESGDEYLNKVGATIHKLLKDVDSDAVWVMQAWSIRKEIVCVVPKDSLLILDLDGNVWKRNDGFWGYDFVGGLLHNFGGRINLHGDLKFVLSNPVAAAKKDIPNMTGAGLFMEGIRQNPVFYDAAFSMFWEQNPMDAKSWLHGFSRRRYGMDSKHAFSAWQKLLEGPYREGTGDVENSSIVCARPALDVKKSGPNAGFNIPYPPMLLADAWRDLLEDHKLLHDIDTYGYDVVDVGRQVLSNLGQELHKDAIKAFRGKDQALFAETSAAFLELLDDLDALLATRREFSLAEWIADARNLGTTEREKDLYEWNASMLITWWGPIDEPIIFDYAWREWSGLIRTYYKVRWQKFYDYLASHLKNGTEYSEDGLPLAYGRETLRANSFYSELADWEKKWIESRKDLPVKTVGDPVDSAQSMFVKYESRLRYIYSRQKDLNTLSQVV